MSNFDSVGANAAVDEAELERLRAYLERLFPTHLRRHPETLWHYTSAVGLINIVRSGHLYSTHISCLNDSMEFRYFDRVIQTEIEARLVEEQDAGVRRMLGASAKMLHDRDVSSIGSFVTCFTSVSDDLGQWRGYGGPECGFAIEFDTSGLIAVAQARPRTMLARVIYDEDRHQSSAREVVDNVTTVFKRLEGQSLDPMVVDAYAEISDMLHVAAKHPKFEGEKEYRLATKLLTGEHDKLEFTGRRTLLARHLPLDLRQSSGLMPIRSVMVGPGGAKDASRVSVGDLLKRYGYDGLPVTASDTPYRFV